MSAQFYDPLCFYSPYTFKFRVAMREVVGLNTTWDNEVPDDMSQSWKKLILDLDTITSEPVKFPRPFNGKYHGPDKPTFELVGFWDGSDVGYCAAVYCWWRSHPGAP